jgi:hypothetical protein
VLFRFTFPRAKGAKWNVVLLTFVPICAGIIPYLYALEASARYFPSRRVSSRLFYNDIRMCIHLEYILGGNLQ